MNLSTFCLKYVYSSPQKLYIASGASPQFTDRPKDQKRCVSSAVNGLILHLRFCFASFLSTHSASHCVHGCPFKQRSWYTRCYFMCTSRLAFIVHETIQQPLPASYSPQYLTFIVPKKVIFLFSFSITEENYNFLPPSPSKKDFEGKSGTKVSRTFSYIKNKMSSSKKSKVSMSWVFSVWPCQSVTMAHTQQVQTGVMAEGL